MTELKIFNNPEFGEIRTVELDGEPWLVGKDVAEALGYSDTKSALADHVDDEDKQIIQRRQIATLDIPNRGLTIINESGLYSLVLSSKLPGAKKFKRWVTSEVLPSIRRTGGYRLPQDFPSALRALADAEEKRMLLAAENEKQRQVIADFEPIRQYVDTILESTGTMTTTQIAADYGMSAKQLNRILNEAGIQRNVNGQWILYKKYMGQGYTDSKTFNFIHTDGRPDARINTMWTQKGRLLIHTTLEKRGIRAVMDRSGTNKSAPFKKYIEYREE